MFGAIAVLFILPWLDKNPIKSIRYRNTAHKINIVWFAVFFLILGYLGVMPVTDFFRELGTRATQIYFLFFLVTIAHSNPAKAKYFWWFIALFAFVLFTDWLRWDASFTGPQRHYFWVMLALPAVYLASTLLLPMIASRCNAEKVVPERVTG